MDQARDLVRDLTLQGQDEIKLIAVMLGQFRTFTQVKICQSLDKQNLRLQVV